MHGMTKWKFHLLCWKLVCNRRSRSTNYQKTIMIFVERRIRTTAAEHFILVLFVKSKPRFWFLFCLHEYTQHWLRRIVGENEYTFSSYRYHTTLAPTKETNERNFTRNISYVNFSHGVAICCVLALDYFDIVKFSNMFISVYQMLFRFVLFFVKNRFVHIVLVIYEAYYELYTRFTK